MQMFHHHQDQPQVQHKKQQHRSQHTHQIMDQIIGDLIQFSDSESDDLFVSSSAFDFGLDWKPGHFGHVGRAPSSLASSGSPPIMLTGRNHHLNHDHHHNQHQHLAALNALSDWTKSRSSPSSRSSALMDEEFESNSLYQFATTNMPKAGTNREEISNTGRLHVSNIPFRYRREHLANMFSIFGAVLDAEVIFNERGSKGFGFVSFAKASDAYKAKKALDNLIIDGRQIEVNYATPRPRRWSKRSQSSSSKS